MKETGTSIFSGRERPYRCCPSAHQPSNISPNPMAEHGLDDDRCVVGGHREDEMHLILIDISNKFSQVSTSNNRTRKFGRRLDASRSNQLVASGRLIGRCLLRGVSWPRRSCEQERLAQTRSPAHRVRGINDRHLWKRGRGGYDSSEHALIKGAS